MQDSAPNDRRLIDFRDAREAPRWSPVDDGVMGGLSASRFVFLDTGSCAFEGRVSLENNGGFCSVQRREGALELTGASALLLTSSGDGKDYKLRLRARGKPDGVFYQARFSTEAATWHTQHFTSQAFTPVRRGAAVPSARPLDFQDAWGVGLLISDAQAGPFRLELASLVARS